MKLRTLAMITILGVFGFGSTARADQLVVIASNTELFKLGTIVDASQELVLPPDTSITLIAADGKSVKLTGPYKGNPNSGSSAQNKSLIETLSEIASKEYAPELAVFRKAGTRAGLWAIDVGKSGVNCARSDENIKLWRKNASIDSRLKIIPRGNPGDAVSLNWPRGEHVFDWPGSLSIKDGETYVMKLEDTSREQQVKIYTIPQEYATDAHRVVWMWENECPRQARRLFRSLANEH